MSTLTGIARTIACSAALAMSLAIPFAYASASDFDGDLSDLGTGVAYAQSYVDEDEDGYDDNTDEWIGYGTASALAAQAGEPASDGGSGGSASSGSPSAAASTSNSSSGSSTSSSSSSSDKKDDSKSGDKDSSNKESDKDKEKTSNAFTFAGTGTTVDNATSNDGVEFFTIKTDDDKVYYLVVDRNAGSENVYLLNTVTGSDLQALAESGTINLGTPAVTQPKEEKPEAAAEQPEQQQGDVPEWLAYLLVVAVVGGGAFAYYRLKVKPEREESKVDEREVRSFESDGIYPSEEFGQYDNSWE